LVVEELGDSGLGGGGKKKSEDAKNNDSDNR
jgi:hypothetical protein